MTKPERIFDAPGTRACTETMASWLEGEPVWPYQKILDVWGIEFEDEHNRWRRMTSSDVATALVEMTDEQKTQGRFQRYMSLYEIRAEYIGRYGFMIPCAELLDVLAEHGPIVEVGAGSGYMTRLMRNRGIDVIGSDIDARESDSGHGFIVAKHDPGQVQKPAKTMVRRHRDRAVFCSWPTYRATWFRQALRAMRIGQTIITTREDCLAEQSAWDYLNDCFEEQQRITLPCFPYIHDDVGVYVKRHQDVQPKNRIAMLGNPRSASGRAAARDAK